MHRPFAAPSANTSRTAHKPVTTADHEYPSIDEFLDELPPIESFLAAEEEPAVEETAAEESAVAEYSVEEYSAEEYADEPLEETPHNEDWITAGWNSYDFSSLSDLVNRTPSKPVRAFEPARPRTSQNTLTAPGPSAEEVASALDGIARRIRSGELVIDSLHGTPPEAAMAAAIAALLRMRE